MSEPTFPVGAGPASSTAVETAETAGNRRALVALAALGAAAVLGIAAYVFVLGGGDDEPAAVTAPPGTTSTEAPAADPNGKPGGKSKGGKDGPVTPAANSVGRNPFEPLVTEQVAAETGTSTGTPVVDPVTGLPVDPGTTPTDPGTTPVVPAPTEPITIMLNDVDAGAQTVVATVDGEEYSAALGETFATYFTFVGLRGDGKRALFLYGEITLPLREGAQATVSPGGK